MTIAHTKAKNRSGKATCEICGTETILHEHHILGRKIPNWNKAKNKCNICPNCHTKVHAGHIVIEGWFNTTRGLQLFWHQQETT